MKYNSNCILIQQSVKDERINLLRTSFIGVSCILLRTLIRVLDKLDSRSSLAALFDRHLSLNRYHKRQTFALRLKRLVNSKCSLSSFSKRFLRKEHH